MTGRMAVVIAVDGLRASAVGAYGNTWQPTPELDVLASQSVVVDWMMCESPELAAFYEAAWGAGSLPKALGEVGGSTLVTDDAAVAAWGEAAGFGEVLRLESEAAALAHDVPETALAGLFAVAAANLPSVGVPGLLWIHARGFQGPWDAPLEMRAALLDDDDPEAPTFVDPPKLATTTDHDEVLVYRAAYAAQAAVLDECVGGLLAAVADAGLEDQALVVLVGSGGFALGEHGVVGADDRRLYGERLHVPCLLRLPASAPGSNPAPPRWRSLATPRDLHATLMGWFGASEGDTADAFDLLADDPESRPVVIARGADGEVALRTPSWMLRLVPPDGADDGGEQVDGKAAPDGVELYVKPDDRWEANEVADRCVDAVVELLATLKGLDTGAPAAATRGNHGT